MNVFNDRETALVDLSREERQVAERIIDRIERYPRNTPERDDLPVITLGIY